jgi:hypothetical protein
MTIAALAVGGAAGVALLTALVVVIAVKFRKKDIKDDHSVLSDKLLSDPPFYYEF